VPRSFHYVDVTWFLVTFCVMRRGCAICWILVWAGMIEPMCHTWLWYTWMCHSHRDSISGGGLQVHNSVLRGVTYTQCGEILHVLRMCFRMCNAILWHTSSSAAICHGINCLSTCGSAWISPMHWVGLQIVLHSADPPRSRHYRKLPCAIVWLASMTVSQCYMLAIDFFSPSC
jgi:hypothetical protein